LIKGLIVLNYCDLYVGSYVEYTVKPGYNGTFVVLKPGYNGTFVVLKPGYNGTFVVLKPGYNGAFVVLKSVINPTFLWSSKRIEVSMNTESPWEKR